MVNEQQIQLNNGEGLHARPAGLFVKTAAQFKSVIEVELNGVRKNGKSIMSLMSLGAARGDTLKVIAKGDDSEVAVATLIKLISNNFTILES